MPSEKQKSREAAVALRYIENRETAPRVVAKGWNETARKIISLAEQHNIPLHHDSDLITILMKLDIGQLIPPELYKVIAEVLAYIYRVNKWR